MRLTRRPGICTLIAEDYQLQVRLPELTAVFADPDGRIWSRLSLHASLDRIDMPDDSYGVPEVTVRPAEAAAPAAATATASAPEPVEIEVTAASTAWSARSVLLRCHEDRVVLCVRVEGDGALGEIRLLGGRATLPDGACGTFRSSIEYASVFVPTRTEPVQVVRPAHSGAALGIVGDASAGRRDGVFPPPPLFLAFGREPARHATDVPAGGWLGVGLLAPVDDLRFPQLRYDPL